MKRRRFTEEQIIGVLKEAEAGAKTKDLCRKYGISDATFYNWKAKYGGDDGVRRPAAAGARAREREAEEAAGGSGAGQGGAEGSSEPKMVGPQAKRQAVDVLMAEHGFRVTRACGLVGISRSLYRYRSRRGPGEARRERIIELAAERRRYGYRRIHGRLRREGWEINWKKTDRLYREAGLAVRRRKRKRVGPFERRPLPKPTTTNESRSMDFV